MIVALGVVLFAAFLVLGFTVSTRPPAPLDAGELGVLGMWNKVAELCRLAGLFPVYATLCTAALAFGFARRAYLRTVVTLVVMMLGAWKVSDDFKEVFHRHRPYAWFDHEETSAAYASGHAVLALAFYGFVAWAVWRSALPLIARRTIVALCILWILTIGWSRLALGAHYPSDVLGGYLLGGAALCFAIAALRAFESGALRAQTGASKIGMPKR